jgi:uncharacterized protein (TIGR02996 family)
MNAEAGLLATIADDPADPVNWRILADWLDDQGQPDRAELSRLTLRLRLERKHGHHPRWQKRVRALLAAGVRPCVPELVNSIGMRLVLVPPGTFLMGSASRESRRYADESPRHEVEITRPTWVGKYPLTQAEYERVLGANPSFFQPGRSDNCADLDTSQFPVESINWDDAGAFCRALSALREEKKAGRVYRLPTEAEWEYACRGCMATTFHHGRSLTTAQANFDGRQPYRSPRTDSLGRTCTVGSYPPNAFGLYDLHGNVWEWCADWKSPGYYRDSPRADPPGPPEDGTSETRVSRGGGWSFSGAHCRCAYRGHDDPTGRYNNTGVRIVCAWSGRQAKARRARAGPPEEVVR